MILLSLSDNNKKFLFFNTVDESLGVYTLEYKSDNIQNSMMQFLAQKMQKKDSMTLTSKFKLQYKLDKQASPILKGYKKFSM